MKATLDELRSRYLSMCQIAAIPTRFLTTRQNTGAAHVELSNGVYYYVVTERGSELERRATQSEDELLYWLASDAVFDAASAYELKNRIPGRSIRRLLFEKEIEFMARFRADWVERKRTEIDKILARSPYDDRTEG